MTKSEALREKTEKRYTQIIIETLKASKVQTSQLLVAQVQEKLDLSVEEITQRVLQLESENRIHFTQGIVHLPLTLREYITSAKAIWYWSVFAFACITVFVSIVLPDDILLLLYVRSALGLIFVVFLPGYAFVRLLFPPDLNMGKETSLNVLEIIVFSLCVSLSLVPAVAFGLNYTSFGITLTSVAFSLLLLTVVLATAAVVLEYYTKTSSPQGNN
jgi:hypothetical protein